MENNTERRVCRTCAYVKPTGSGFYKGHATCGSYIGPKAGKVITMDESTCIKHATQIEARAGAIVHTSADCAKSYIERASLEVLLLARQLETAAANRVSVIKMIDVRIRKLEKLNHARPQTAAA